MHSLRKRGGGPGPGRGAGGSAQPVFGNPEEGGQDSLRAPLLVLGFCLGACEAAGDEQQRGLGASFQDSGQAAKVFEAGGIFSVKESRGQPKTGALKQAIR